MPDNHTQEHLHPIAGEQVEVIQADRTGAADLLDGISNLLEHNGIGQVADLIRDGEYDDHPATEAFAKHRLAHSPSPELASGDARHEIVASLIRDAIQVGTDEAADWNAKRIMTYLLVEPRGCPTPGACSAALCLPPAELKAIARQALSTSKGEGQSSTQPAGDDVVERVTAAIGKQMFGPELSPFEHPEYWAFYETVARAALAALPSEQKIRADEREACAKIADGAVQRDKASEREHRAEAQGADSTSGRDVALEYAVSCARRANGGAAIAAAIRARANLSEGQSK